MSIFTVVFYRFMSKVKCESIWGKSTLFLAVNKSTSSFPEASLFLSCDFRHLCTQVFVACGQILSSRSLLDSKIALCCSTDGDGFCTCDVSVSVSVSILHHTSSVFPAAAALRLHHVSREHRTSRAVLGSERCGCG